MRYHLWFTPASQQRPYGVRDSLRDNGRSPACPLPTQEMRFGRLLQGVISQSTLSPFHQPEALCTG